MLKKNEISIIIKFVWLDKLYFVKESCNTTLGSISFVPPIAGLMIAGEIVKDICQINR